MKRLTVTAGIVVLLLSLGFAVAACGAEDDAIAVEPAPTDAAETTGEGAAGTSTETTAETSETTETESSAPVGYEIWLLFGEGLTPVGRSHPATRAVGRASLEDLLEGPSAGERSEGYSTAIPDGVQLLDLNIGDGVATVDLSSEFESGGGSASMFARLGQVVCTLDQFESVRGVRFRLDGEDVEVFSGEGIVLDKPATCADYSEVQPAIVVESPSPGATVSSPVRVSGNANVFEANVTVEIFDADGRMIASTFTTATCGTGCRGDFAVNVRYKLAKEQRGTIVVHDDDAAGIGKPPHSVRIPVTLLPS